MSEKNHTGMTIDYQKAKQEWLDKKVKGTTWACYLYEQSKKLKKRIDKQSENIIGWKAGNYALKKEIESLKQKLDKAQKEIREWEIKHIEATVLYEGVAWKEAALSKQLEDAEKVIEYLNEFTEFNIVGWYIKKYPKDDK
jgi:predicted RNase H-like nuclease (RuvC/YqgF family)